MAFEVPAEAYDRFMGRYSSPLASRFADWARVRRGQRALDVGCGPGALTRVLVDRLDAGAVAAIDPSEPFVAAVRRALPAVDARTGAAESLHHPDAAFDVTLAQLVVAFMADPIEGLREMARVLAPGGTFMLDFLNATRVREDLVPEDHPTRTAPAGTLINPLVSESPRHPPSRWYGSGREW